jgi:hypothetical protein
MGKDTVTGHGFLTDPICLHSAYTVPKLAEIGQKMEDLDLSSKPFLCFGSKL